MKLSKLIVTAIAAGIISGGAALAQATNPFGSFKHDATQPIEITADSLAVDQAAQQATFTGDVLAGQGTLRLKAAKMVVNYGGENAGNGTGQINKMRADGDVFLSNGTETAKGEWAEYDVAGGVVTMGGGVVLTQGDNVVSGQELRIDLNAGAGKISGGRVKSIFTPSGDAQNNADDDATDKKTE